MYNLDDHVALVTGAARGIGEAIARKLAAAGARLVLCDLDEAGINALAESLKADGTEALAVPCDITKADQVEALCKAAYDAFGQVDVLVNNAGVTRDNLLMRMRDDEWDLVLEVNLKGVFRMIRQFARPMMKARRGSIINIASVVGITGNPGQANYSSSKAGVIGLTKSSAKELASRGIRVNAVAPGYIRTAMTEKLSQEVRDQFVKTIPLNRPGTADDVAGAVLYLASDASSYLTGQVIKGDGGMAM